MWRGENTDCAPGSAVTQDDPQHSGGEDDQPGHQAAVAQPAVVQLGAEERKGALVANRGKEEGSQHQDLQTGEVRRNRNSAWNISDQSHQFKSSRD